MQIPIEDIYQAKNYLLELIISISAEDKIEKLIDVTVDNGDFSITFKNTKRFKANKERKEVIGLNTTFQPKNGYELSWLEINGIKPYIPTIPRLDEIVEGGNIV